MDNYMNIKGVNFETLRGKKADLLIEDYRHAERKGYTHLRHVYGSYSTAKERAFEDCDEVRRSVGGGIMYICSIACYYAEEAIREEVLDNWNDDLDEEEEDYE